ncbi:MAG: MoaD/ThiS family protein [Firmicutes bacterium]|nr:MoaD/ThiS family protein [Bacillota bacterium]
MNITVKLFATLRNGRDKIMTIQMPEGSTVSDIVTHMALPREEVAIIMINSRGAELTTELHDTDILALFPPVGGG